MKKGVTEINGSKYFLGEYSGRLITGWVTSSLDGKTYYSKADGKLVSGIQKINGKEYLFTDENYLFTGFTKGEKRYYYKDGIMQKGVTQIGNDLYFMNETTGELITGWVTSSVNGNTYYSDSDGILYKGYRIINEKPYFFGEYSGRLITGWVTSSLDGKTYYSKADGKLLTGFQKIDGTTYYFSEEDNSMKKGVTEINGSKYFLGEYSGRLITGWVKATFTGKTYYSKSDGILVKGEQVIDGSAYKFASDNSLETGWQTINGKTYYFYSDGTKAKYFVKIAGVRYEFSTTGELQHSNIKIIADLSYHNNVYDWDALWSSGEIDGVILRIGYSLGMDRKFTEYLGEARRLGIPYSVYHFSIAENAYEAQNEANSLLKWYSSNSLAPTYGVFYDIESWKNPEDGHTSDGITISDYDSIISTYKAALNQNGIYMSLYTGKNYAETRLSDYGRDQISWIAHYATDCGYKGGYRGWQYTSKGHLPGISGNVDLSVFYY